MKKWLIFTAIATMLMLINVDGTFMTIALASISHYFNLSLAQVKWVQSSYYITTAVSILIFGHLSDKYGAKKIYMIGVLFFGMGSTIAGLCPHFSELIIGRVIQGLGFGATIGVGYIIIHQSFPLQLRGLALGISYTISGLSLAAGPIIAGILVQHYSWRLVLIVNTPFCLFSLYMLWKYATNYAPNKSKSLALTSTLLFIIGSTLLMLILSQCSHLDLNTTLLGLATSLVLLILLISASKHNPNHLLNYSLL